MLSLFFPLLVSQYFQKELDLHLCIRRLFLFHIRNLFVQNIKINFLANFLSVKAAHSDVKVFVTIILYPHICSTEKKRFLECIMVFVLQSLILTTSCIINCFKSQIFENRKIKFFDVQLHENAFTFVLDIFEPAYYCV